MPGEQDSVEGAGAAEPTSEREGAQQPANSLLTTMR
jgi:hypothetical protein